MNQRIDGVSKIISRPFRKCRLDDFEKTGIFMTEEFKTTVVNRLCPDTDVYLEGYKVMNSYANVTERNSF